MQAGLRLIGLDLSELPQATWWPRWGGGGAEVGGIVLSQPQSPLNGQVVEAHWLSAETTSAPV